MNSPLCLCHCLNSLRKIPPHPPAFICYFCNFYDFLFYLCYTPHKSRGLVVSRMRNLFFRIVALVSLNAAVFPCIQAQGGCCNECSLSPLPHACLSWGTVSAGAVQCRQRPSPGAVCSMLSAVKDCFANQFKFSLSCPCKDDLAGQPSPPLAGNRQRVSAALQPVIW